MISPDPESGQLAAGGWRLALAGLLLVVAAPDHGEARPESRPAAALERLVAEAEAALGDGERQVAVSRYRSVLLEGWLLLGAVAVAEGDDDEARQAFAKALSSAVETERAVVSLALVDLRRGATDQAVASLRRFLAEAPTAVAARRLLAQALVAKGEIEEAVAELEEARSFDASDLETGFALATGYLRSGRVEEAERLLVELAEARPLPETWVLIGRTYRDFGLYEQARQALRRALAIVEATPRAHFYLGTVELLAEGRARLDEAIDHFRRQLRWEPLAPLGHLYLGMALTEARRFEEALSPLGQAAATESLRADALYYQGRALLALDRPDEALEVLRAALAKLNDLEPDDRQLSSFHYQLALALRGAGQVADAAPHFAAAERHSRQETRSARRQLSDYLNDRLDREVAATLLVSTIEGVSLPPLDREQRSALRRTVTVALARSYLNLGVLKVQAAEHARAAEYFESVLELDPEFPRARYALGVAYFNAGRYAEAIGPLSLAADAAPADSELRRMLAMAHLNAGSPEGAASLLRDDKRRRLDPSLEYAFALALVRSGQLAEAEEVFGRLLREHSQWPELQVLLGQAQAQQGNYEAAIEALEKALRLDPRVAEAHATLGVIFLRQGRLDEAERELAAELEVSPGDDWSRVHLATVLELEQRFDEAAALLRLVLKRQPDLIDARYLLGKILLAEGEAQAAIEQLQAAVTLAPEQANLYYQLGRAFQRLGEVELAQRHFERFRALKDVQRERVP